ncbi:SDR family oxidoreductase [Asticcacaulis sp. 201]|uniref:SDR family oxidoreductase n=1 Tax=Asticcacaulis sp. 201 TaxID=3028787 RepID=UPI0029166394|nr:SDR family oxidoreductase [Asticcacaulis sp. 201]MDV6330679.1 SDR family oxidoreductase [Asticcacaulis sp. 201]
MSSEASHRRLAGEVAVITGAARGIGAATAARFAKEGAKVICVDRKREEGQAVVDGIVADGGDARFIAGDLADEAGVRAIFAGVDAHFGTVSILINNAGIAVFDSPVALTLANWHKCMSVDLEAVWLCTREVLPGMLALKRGAIVNIASVHASQVLKGSFPYGVAKHGVLGLTRALAIEYAAEGIRCNAVSPGYIDTPITQEVMPDHPDFAGFVARMAQLHPPGRVGQPEEVANAALFLASCEASFVNGTNLVVDGGRSLIYHD